MTLNRVYGVHFVGTSACDEWFPREKYASAWSGPGGGQKWSRHLVWVQEPN